jgi:tetratricopeptide (TPR) repeat protein
MSKRCSISAAVLLILVTAADRPMGQTVRDRAREPYVAGLEQMRNEAFDAASRSFAEAINIDPEFDMAHYMLGRVNLAQKNYSAAVQSLVKARDLFAAQNTRNFADRREGQRVRRERLAGIDDLISNLQRATPQTFQIREQIRQLEERKRQLEDLDRDRDLNPDKQIPAFVSLSLGSALYRAGRIPEAETAYLAAVAADARTGEAHNNLAVVYLETGRYLQARASLRAAEKAGVKVHPALKAEIEAKVGGKQGPLTR